MSTEDNKATVRRYMEEYINQGSLPAAEATIAPELIFHDPLLPEPLRGREAFTQFIAALRATFPDMQFTTEALLAAEDETVVVRWTIRATQRGELMGIPPTGKSIEAGGIDILRLADGRIAEGWVQWDGLRAMQQLGVIPALGQATG